MCALANQKANALKSFSHTYYKFYINFSMDQWMQCGSVDRIWCWHLGSVPELTLNCCVTLGLPQLRVYLFLLLPFVIYMH